MRDTKKHKISLLHRRGILVAFLFLVMLAGASIPGFGQGANPIIRTAVSDNEVYVYHTLRISTGHGFNIYRSDDGVNFQKLNDQPVRGAQNANQFVAEVNAYIDLLMEAVNEEQPQMVFFKLQANRIAANLATFYYPDVARAMGRLYVDRTIDVNSTVHYRIEVVDDRGNPTGETLTREVTLRPREVPRPYELQATHRKREVTLNWKYPSSSLENDDKVVRFNVYDRRGSELRKINEKPIIRINNFSDFRYVFTVPRRGMTLNLVVMPVDLTLQEGPPSEVLEYVVEDNVPPNIISGLEARPRDDGNVEITWPVSPEADAAGYNLYRADRIKGNYSRLNDEPIHLLETFYTDRPSRQRTSYFYRVTVIDSSGNESKRSNAAKADVMDLIPPEAPASLTATAREDGTVELQWDVLKQEPDLKTYVITRRQVERFSGTAESQLNQEDVTETIYIDRGEAGLSLAEGARYQYSVFAVDSARNFSDTVSSTIQIPDRTPPEPPTRLTVENDRGIRAVLRWNASRSNDVTRYQIFRASGDDTLSLYRELTVNDRFMRDDSVKIGLTYRYAISSVDSLDNEGEVTKSGVFRMKDFTPPRSVRNVRALTSGDTVRITWEPVPTPDVVGYRIYTAPIPTGKFEPLTGQTVKETSFMAGKLDPSTWIRVRAVDSSGNESRPGEAVRIYAE